MEIYIQITCAALIILIGVVSIIKNRERISVIKMSYLAMFLTLAVVISYFSISTRLLGSKLVLSFGQMPMMIMGATLGPVYSFIGGLARDGMGLITTPTNFPFLGFTLNKILVPLLPALSVKYIKKGGKGILQTLLNLYIIYFVFVVNLFNFEVINQKIVLLLILFALLLAVNIVFKRYEHKIVEQEVLIPYFIGVVLVELVVQGTLTPFWLSTMYGSPFVVSAFMRLLKGVIMILVNGFVGGRVYLLAHKHLNVNKRV